MSKRKTLEKSIKYFIKYHLFFCFFVDYSESAKMDSKPTSWPRSRMESHITKTSREKRKLQSSSPSSRNHPASIRHMKRFQKSTAIYTLPIRGKQHNGTHCKTGELMNNYVFFMLQKQVFDVFKCSFFFLCFFHSCK